MVPQAEIVVIAAKKHAVGQGKDLKRAWGSEAWLGKSRMAGSLAGIQDGRKADELERHQGYSAKGLSTGMRIQEVMDLRICI